MYPQDSYGEKVKRWDVYYKSICDAVAEKSPCLSRKIGAILVLDHSIISTGYNGPPRNIPHCGPERFEKDKSLSFAPALEVFKDLYASDDIETTCPRRLMGIRSGEGLEWCSAQHAEENAVTNAARIGVSTIGATLYMNSVIPCQKCFGTLINAGIVEIVIDSVTDYDNHTRFLIDYSQIKIRRFRL